MISQISFMLFVSSGDRNKRKFGKKGRWEDLETKTEKASSLCHLLKLMQTLPVSTIPMQTKQMFSLLCTQQQSLCCSVVLSMCTNHDCTVPGRPKTLPSPVGLPRDSGAAARRRPTWQPFACPLQASSKAAWTLFGGSLSWDECSSWPVLADARCWTRNPQRRAALYDLQVEAICTL